jgi:hypothetical protein
MKIQVTLLLLSLLVGCINSTQIEKQEIIEEEAVDVQTNNSTENSNGELKAVEIDITGEWNLKMISFPWERTWDNSATKKEKRDNIPFTKIHFESSSELTLFLMDSVVRTASFYIEHRMSSFSLDSVWVLVTTLADSHAESSFEIVRNGNELSLLEQCDDCLTFVLTKMESEIEKRIHADKTEFATYVVYEDSLPIYDSANGEVLSYFRFEDDPSYDFGGGFTFSNSMHGWLQVSENESYSKVSSYWIKSSNVMIGTRNYGNEVISLKSQPNDASEISGFIYQETETEVLEFYNNWVYISVDGEDGWLSPEFICTNPMTTCN